jgi:YD repeat-containing protein
VSKILYNGDDAKLGKLIKPPYFKILQSSGIPNKNWAKILSNTFDKTILISGSQIYDENRNKIYSEKFGEWEISEYDENGNEIYNEKDDGTWTKFTYDKNGNLLSKIGSEGIKSTFDKDGSLVSIDSIDN